MAQHWIEGDPALRSRFVFDPHLPADLRLATTRWFEHRGTGRVLHVVERMGVPLLYVLDVSPGAGELLVLEGGDLALSLPGSSRWSGGAVTVPGDERAAWVLRGENGAPTKAELWLLTPRSGPVPVHDALREKVAELAAKVFGEERDANAVRPVTGVEARGWMVTGELEGRDVRRLVAVAAVRVGEAALVVIAQADGDPTAEALRLVEWLKGARPAREEERRRP